MSLKMRLLGRFARESNFWLLSHRESLSARIQPAPCVGGKAGLEICIGELVRILFDHMDHEQGTCYVPSTVLFININSTIHCHHYVS